MNRHDPTTVADQWAAAPIERSAGRPGPALSQIGADRWIAVPTEIGIDAANMLIQQLLSVGLTLASCAQMVTGPAAERLAAAVDDVDAIIAGLRNAAVRELAARGAEQAILTDGEIGIEEIVNQLAPLARNVTGLCEAAKTDKPAAIPLLDAGHSLYRALTELTAECLLLDAPTSPTVTAGATQSSWSDNPPPLRAAMETERQPVGTSDLPARSASPR